MATYYTTDPTKNPPLGSDEYYRQQELSKKLGVLVSNPSYRDIPADAVMNFLTGKKSWEETEAAVMGSPTLCVLCHIKTETFGGRSVNYLNNQF